MKLTDLFETRLLTVKFNSLFESRKIISEGISHPEDLIISNGSEGANRVVNELLGLEKDSSTVSIKWDGFPAVVFGRDASGNLVFVDKHMFDKIAKGKMEFSSIEDYDTGRGADRQDLWAKEQVLRPALEQIVPQVVDKYWMGDLLWTGVPPVKDGFYSFKPNTVEYQVAESGSLGSEIAKSVGGIAVHTVIPGLGQADVPLKGLEGLAEGKGVVLLTGEIKHASPKVKVDKKFVSETKNIIHQYGPAADTFISDLAALKAKTVLTNMSPFITKMLEHGDIKTDIIERFLDFLSSKLSPSAAAKLIGTNKDGWLYKEGAVGLESIWKLWAAVTDLKIHIKQQLDAQLKGSEVRALINGEDSHEGYVFGAGSEKLKLVDRLGFTAAHFSKFKVPDEEIERKKSMPMAVFCFGRMNPPTIGHELVMRKTVELGGKNGFIFLSGSVNGETDPLDPKTKAAFISKMYPDLGSHIVGDAVLNPIYAANWLYDKGFRNITFVAGSDRLGASKGSLEKILAQWNSGPIRTTDNARGPQGREHVVFNFVSSGDRDADTSSVSGISGTLARKYAAEGKKKEFEGATGFTDKIKVGGKSLYQAVRHGMGLSDIVKKELKEGIDLQDFLYDFPAEMDRKELLNLVYDHINMLSPEKKDIVKRWTEGEKIADIARELDVTDKSLRSKLQLALREIYKGVQHEYGKKDIYHNPMISTDLYKLWNKVKNNPNYKITTLTGGQFQIVKKNKPVPEVVPNEKIIRDKKLVYKKYADLKNEAMYRYGYNYANAKRKEIDSEAEKWLKLYNKIKQLPEYTIIDPHNASASVDKKLKENYDNYFGDEKETLSSAEYYLHEVLHAIDTGDVRDYWNYYDVTLDYLEEDVIIRRIARFIDRYLLQDKAKLIKLLLGLIKHQSNPQPAEGLFAAIRSNNVDWPELAVIEKALKSNLKENDDDDDIKLKELFSFYIKELLDAIRKNDMPNFDDYYAWLMDITWQDEKQISKAIAKEIKVDDPTEKDAFIKILLSMIKDWTDESEYYSRGILSALKMRKVNWPELAVIEKALKADLKEDWDEDYGQSAYLNALLSALDKGDAENFEYYYQAVLEEITEASVIRSIANHIEPDHPKVKEHLMKLLLNIVKNDNDVGVVKGLIEAIRWHVDWPELNIIEKSLNSNLKEGETKRADDNGNTKCWKGYRKVGLKKKGNKMVNDCRLVKKAKK